MLSLFVPPEWGIPFGCMRNKNKMKIYFSQIYIEVGVTYPFTHIFQKYLSDEISARVNESAEFSEKFGEGYSIMFRISAKSDIENMEIKGPTVFKKDKDVEYSLFIPFKDFEGGATKSCEYALNVIVDVVLQVLFSYKFDVSGIEKDRKGLIERILNDVEMIRS